MNRKNNMEIFDCIADYRVVPVIAIEDIESAIPLADALIEGGLPVAEITFRTKAAAEVIFLLKKERPQLMLGAGTVLTSEQAKTANSCGASFAVAPGLNPSVVNTAQTLGLPFAPGVMTPSNVETAISMDLKVLKFFPAGAIGGPPFLKSLVAPYAHLGVKFIPTGGVNAENMSTYFELPHVMAVGGTWIAKRDDIAAGRWEKIRKNCQSVVNP